MSIQIDERKNTGDQSQEFKRRGMSVWCRRLPIMICKGSKKEERLRKSRVKGMRRRETRETGRSSWNRTMGQGTRQRAGSTVRWLTRPSAFCWGVRKTIFTPDGPHRGESRVVNATKVIMLAGDPEESLVWKAVKSSSPATSVRAAVCHCALESGQGTKERALARG